MDLYHIYSDEYQLYYRKDSAGYTDNETEAGLFSENFADKILKHARPEKKLRKIPVFNFRNWLHGQLWNISSETTLFKVREQITIVISIEHGLINCAIRDFFLFKECLIPTTEQEAQTLFKLFRLL